MRQKRTTIIDLAKACNVSKTTVSFAFNNPERIGKETYNLIMEKAKELDYIPNPAGRNFSLKKKETIGFLLPQNFEGTLSNPYITQVIQGIGNICSKKDFTLTLIPPSNGSMNDAVFKVSVDGLIAIGINVEMELVESLKRIQIPLVTIDGHPGENMPSINIDDKKASYELMKKVLEFGHRKIAIVRLRENDFDKSSKYASTTKMRLEGFDKALGEYGLSLKSSSITIYDEECNIESGKRVAQNIINDRLDSTCIVCMSDVIAIGCITYFNQNSYDLPNDFSIVGFDNIEISKLITPNLTTIMQASIEKGQLAAETLFKLIDGEEVNNIHKILPHKLIIRDSLKKLI
ncbi:MAG: LacI family DNA-binding transcriptional regulator [Pleomorphochaeta sp.]